MKLFWFHITAGWSKLVSLHTATQLCLFLIEGSDTFLILLVLFWSSLRIFLSILSKSIQVVLQAYLGEADHQEQVIPLWRRQEWGKGKTPAVLACSSLNSCETVFIVAFYGLLPASNHCEVNINLVSWKIGRNSWTSSGLAVFLVEESTLPLQEILGCFAMWKCFSALEMTLWSTTSVFTVSFLMILRSSSSSVKMKLKSDRF